MNAIPIGVHVISTARTFGDRQSKKFDCYGVLNCGVVNGVQISKTRNQTTVDIQDILEYCEGYVSSYWRYELMTEV